MRSEPIDFEALPKILPFFFAGGADAAPPTSPLASMDVDDGVVRVFFHLFSPSTCLPSHVDFRRVDPGDPVVLKLGNNPVTSFEITIESSKDFSFLLLAPQTTTKVRRDARRLRSTRASSPPTPPTPPTPPPIRPSTWPGKAFTEFYRVFFYLRLRTALSLGLTAVENDSTFDWLKKNRNVDESERKRESFLKDLNKKRKWRNRRTASKRRGTRNAKKPAKRKPVRSSATTTKKKSGERKKRKGKAKKKRKK